MVDLLIRFLIGGVVVSFFAALGDIFRPKSFAGLFGAAPSIALATVGLTVHTNGALFAAVEARSMVFGAIAFFFYALAVSYILRRYRPSALVATVCMMPLWLAISFGLWALMRGEA